LNDYSRREEAARHLAESLRRENDDLKEKNATFRERLARLAERIDSESRNRLLRHSAITIGLLVIGAGYEVSRSAGVEKIGWGLMFFGAVLALAGWWTRDKGGET
jgi:hypothetical protein